MNTVSILTRVNFFMTRVGLHLFYVFLVDFSTTLPEQVLVIVDIGIWDVRWCSLLIGDLSEVD